MDRRRKVLNTEEAAGMIGIHKLTLRRLIREKKIPAININAGVVRPRYRLYQQDVKAFIEKRRQTI